MDTLSSSVSTLNVPALHSASRQLYHLKTPLTCHQFPPPHFITKPNSISNRTISQFSSLNTLNSPCSASHLSPSKSSSVIHRNPASGYAAALVDIAQCNNSLSSVLKDVQRLSRLLHDEGIWSLLNNPLLGEKEKRRIIKKVEKNGKFNRFLVRLMKMLMEKNKVTLVNQVLVEFQRICDELSGTKVVLFSSKNKMEEIELFGIAERVQKLSGAVQVKVRNMVDAKLPSFAV